jgi:hypothetical protein
MMHSVPWVRKESTDVRKYPEPSDYQAAIQNPNLVLREPQLRTAHVRLNRLGIPLVSSGGFALSFYLDTPGGEQWVVRCFKTDSPDRRARYDAISRFLNTHPAPFLLDVDYYEQGILVDGAWYPIVKMPRVQGITLQRYIEAELTAGHSIAGLSGRFRAMMDELARLGIAHGDLQHGNIMVESGHLVLVDYDGMFVPDLQGWPAAEQGSAGYQHPQRTEQFALGLDRFSAIVIDMALQALVAAPGLWPKYNTGENILFSQSDFCSPDGSRLLHDLEQIPYLAAAVHKLRKICQGPYDAIPRLGDVLPPLPGNVQPVLSLTARTPLPVVRRAAEVELDQQLNRLYANWTPPQAVSPAAPAPAVSSLPVWLQKLNAALSSRKAQEIDLAIRRFIAGLALVMGVSVYVASCIRDSTQVRVMLGAATPPAAAATAGNGWQRPISAYACPTDLYISLQKPRDTVLTNSVTFTWFGSNALEPQCSYRLKLWHDGGTPIELRNRRPVKVTGEGYQVEVRFLTDLPYEQRYNGRFYWTVELVDSSQAESIVPTHSVPLAFDWQLP